MPLAIRSNVTSDQKNKVDLTLSGGRAPVTFQSVKKYGWLTGWVLSIFCQACKVKCQDGNSIYIKINSLSKRIAKGSPTAKANIDIFIKKKGKFFLTLSADDIEAMRQRAEPVSAPSHASTRIIKNSPVLPGPSSRVSPLPALPVEDSQALNETLALPPQQNPYSSKSYSDEELKMLDASQLGPDEKAHLLIDIFNADVDDSENRRRFALLSTECAIALLTDFNYSDSRYKEVPSPFRGRCYRLLSDQHLQELNPDTLSQKQCDLFILSIFTTPSNEITREERVRRLDLLSKEQIKAIFNKMSPASILNPKRHFEIWLGPKFADKPELLAYLKAPDTPITLED